VSKVVGLHTSVTSYIAILNDETPAGQDGRQPSQDGRQPIKMKEELTAWWEAKIDGNQEKTYVKTDANLREMKAEIKSNNEKSSGRYLEMTDAREETSGATRI
jgi:hypothetical protein